jgi:hypothetical protein
MWLRVLAAVVTSSSTLMARSGIKPRDRGVQNDSHFFCRLDILREDNAANQQNNLGK